MYSGIRVHMCVCMSPQEDSRVHVLHLFIDSLVPLTTMPVPIDWAIDGELKSL